MPILKVSNDMQKYAMPDEFSHYVQTKTKTVKCPRLSCGQMSYVVDEKNKKGDFSGGECQSCGWGKPANGLGAPTVRETGFDSRYIKGLGGIRINVPPRSTAFASKTKQNIEKIRTMISNKMPINDPGAFLDDSIVVTTDKTHRMQNLLQTSAQLELESKRPDDMNPQSNEEQQ